MRSGGGEPGRKRRTRLLIGSHLFVPSPFHTSPSRFRRKSHPYSPPTPPQPPLPPPSNPTRRPPPPPPKILLALPPPAPPPPPSATRANPILGTPPAPPPLLLPRARRSLLRGLRALREALPVRGGRVGVPRPLVRLPAEEEGRGSEMEKSRPRGNDAKPRREEEEEGQRG